MRSTVVGLAAIPVASDGERLADRLLICLTSGFQRKLERLFDLQRRTQSRGQEIDRRRCEDIVDADAIDRAGIDQPSHVFALAPGHAIKRIDRRPIPDLLHRWVMQIVAQPGMPREHNRYSVHATGSVSIQSVMEAVSAP